MFAAASPLLMGLSVSSHTKAFGFPILTVIVAIPAISAAVMFALPKAMEKAAQWLAFAASLATLLCAAILAFRFKAGPTGYQFVTKHWWVKTFGISWNLGVDGISVFLVLMTAFIVPIVLAGTNVTENRRSYAAWMLLLEAACLASFMALDVFLFFVAFELTLIPAYFLIAAYGQGRRGFASIKFFIYTLFGSAFLLVAILVVAFSYQAKTGHLSFDLIQLSSLHLLSTSTAKWLFVAFTIAFAVKAPIFPFHTWSPDAYEAAPTGGSVALSAIMAKLGTYGIIRFDFALFPKATVDLAPIFLTLGVVGILYGAIVAAVQKDLKRLVAFSSLSHIGFIVLGLFAFTSQSITGGILQMVNHGILTAGLFLLLGMIYERRKTNKISELSGLQKAAPVLAGTFTLVMLASVGLPGLNGFVGEFLILIGTFATHRWWAVVATSGVILAAVYLLWAYQRVFHRKAEGENAKVADMSWRERAVLLPIVVAIVFIGVYPRPFLSRITPTANAMVKRALIVGDAKVNQTVTGFNTTITHQAQQGKNNPDPLIKSAHNSVAQNIPAKNNKEALAK